MKRHDLQDEMEPSIFMIDYPHNGGIYTARILAYDLEDAQAQLSALQAYGYIEGELAAEGEVASMAVN